MFLYQQLGSGSTVEVDHLESSKLSLKGTDMGPQAVRMLIAEAAEESPPSQRDVTVKR